MEQGKALKALRRLSRNFDVASRVLYPERDSIEDLSQISELHPVRAVVMDEPVKYFPVDYSWESLERLTAQWDERWAPALRAPGLRWIDLSRADQSALDALDRSLDTPEGFGRLYLHGFVQRPGAAWFREKFVSDFVGIEQSRQVDFTHAGPFCSIGLLSLGDVKSVRGLAHLSQQGTIRLLDLTAVKFEDPDEFWNIRAERIALSPRNRKEAAWFYEAWDRRPPDWMDRVRFGEFLAQDLYPDWADLEIKDGFYASFEQEDLVDIGVDDLDDADVEEVAGGGPNRSGDSSPRPRAGSQGRVVGVEAVSVVEFWEVVEGSRRVAGGDVEAQVEALQGALGRFAPERIAGFEQVFVSLHRRLYDWGLWGVAYLLLGGCSDDGFVDVRSWVIGQGRDFYERCLADPRALASGGLEDREDIGDAELLAYAAGEAYEEVTGRELEEDYPDLGGVFDVDEPTGEPWTDEDDLQARFPDIEPLD
ncbi:DUF4240 domain-containing protein [Zhihengliuella sp.]|uniref:DUF4240 domain-containing protein n=1 Tax=Zhihengliuella sp. TaxID=1954483 RepID=UPI0028112AB9|nr:DUF4240 domain-containing protein [Zhihengliuella sp.]